MRIEATFNEYIKEQVLVDQRCEQRKKAYEKIKDTITNELKNIKNRKRDKKRLEFFIRLYGHRRFIDKEHENICRSNAIVQWVDLAHELLSNQTYKFICKEYGFLD
jgi:hypothetical protein